MKKPARHHHYIPQFYLAGFTNPEKKTPKLCVLDIIERNQFETSPRNVGAQRDFNRVDVPGLAIDAVEQSLSQFEGQAAAVLKGIRANHLLPRTDEDFSVLMYFVALLHVRNPQHRDALNSTMNRLAKVVMDLTLATPERWETSIAKLKEQGKDIPDVSYEDMKKHVDEERSTVEVATGYHVALELNTLNSILPYLFARTWSLLIAPDKNTFFVCSDCPVRLVWNKPMNGYPPGLAHRNTEVTIPLGNYVALVGAYEGKSRTIEVNAQTVAEVNMRTISTAERQIYSAGDFKFMMNDGSLDDASFFLS